jgi:hypothetical protein
LLLKDDDSDPSPGVQRLHLRFSNEYQKKKKKVRKIVRLTVLSENVKLNRNISNTGCSSPIEPKGKKKKKKEEEAHILPPYMQLSSCKMS